MQFSDVEQVKDNLKQNKQKKICSGSQKRFNCLLFNTDARAFPSTQDFVLADQGKERL